MNTIVINDLVSPHVTDLKEVKGIMANKTVPFSVRLAEEDAEYIAQLTFHEAITPSDKIRTIIRKAREEELNNSKKSYKDFVEKIQSSLLPILVEYRTKELEQGIHSELIKLFIEWVAEAMAFLLATDKNTYIEQFENDLANRIFLLFERVLRMGVTEQAPCYDKSLIRNKFMSILELFEIIQSKIAIGEC